MPVQQCAACGKPLVPNRTVLQCSCGGTWISELAFKELAGTRRLPWRLRAGKQRPCPTCKQPMQIASLAGVVLDRCQPHGVWCDKGELAAVVERLHAEAHKPVTPVLGSRTGHATKRQRAMVATLLDKAEKTDKLRR